ncbi:MAG TPA: acyltransferase [Patescibacteria group bacterium]|nr:acyltransferase [Patescibacteria group bacterium]
MSDKKGYFVHEKAMCESEVGEGTRIWAYAHVMKNATVGKNCNIGEHSFVESGAIVGDNCTIKNGVAIWDGVKLESDVFVGPYATFTNDMVPRTKSISSEFHLVSTTIKRGSSIGANATIICGTVLGQFCMIGAGSVVTKDVPDFALVYGNPAKVCGWVSMEGERLDFSKGDEVSDSKGRRYLFKDNKISLLN